MTLTLVRMLPDVERLSAWAARRGYLPLNGGDLGYALHAGLGASLGDLAPKPFYWRDGEDGAELYGYSRADPATLQAAAAIPSADVDLRSALNVANLEAQSMPNDWRLGQELAFECRVRPVVRQNREGQRTRFREVDAAAHAAAKAPHAIPLKSEAYLGWTAARMQGAAEIQEASILAMKRTRCLRRPLAESGRRAETIDGPDVTLRGKLRITDQAAFAALLARGVGRHRAFGFGMLLLAPPGAL